MHSYVENDEDIGESYKISESDCSETPSELEARLYSILHYNDLTQPLPPEISSEYAITISGTEVCISANNNPTSAKKIMTEDDNKANTLNQPGDFSRNEETETAPPSTVKKRLDIDLENELPTYVTYLAWMNRSHNRKLIRHIRRTVPCHHDDTTSLVEKYVDTVRTMKKRMKEEELQLNVLKKFFSEFIIAACVPRGIKESEAVEEFINLLSLENAAFFSRHCAGEISALYSNICREFSSKKKLVREVILKKFQLFMNEDKTSNRTECVEKFIEKSLCFLGESVLLNNTNLQKQLYTMYENHCISQKTGTGVENKKHLYCDDLEDSSNNSFEDAVPLKKRKLDNGKEPEITLGSQGQTCSVAVLASRSENELRSFLSKHNPGMDEEEILFKVFNEFHEFSMKEKLSSSRHKFAKVFAKYSRVASCFNSLYSGLIDEGLFRKLFVFGNQRSNQQKGSCTKTIKMMIESLVKEALPAKSAEKMNEASSFVSNNEVSGQSSSTLDEIDSSKNVIVLSSDESDVEIVNSNLERNDILKISSDNVWINTRETSHLSEESHLPLEEISPIPQSFSPESSNLNQLVSSYASNCPPSWSKEMIDHYCKSWGGETFDHADILKELKATTNSSDWKILNYQDLIPIRKRKRSSQQCNRCLQWGHLQYQCKEPSKPVVCSICGEYNHLPTACKNTKCLRCGARTRKFLDACEVCRSPQKLPIKCTICESDKHSLTFCPDTWRRYHLTVKGDVVVPPELQMNPRQFCCNCAKAGHLDYFCPLLTESNKFNVVNSPFVLNYNVETSNVSDKSNYNEVSDNNTRFFSPSSVMTASPYKPKKTKRKRYWSFDNNPKTFPRGQNHSPAKPSPWVARRGGSGGRSPAAFSGMRG